MQVMPGLWTICSTPLVHMTQNQLLGRTFFVTENDVFLGDEGVHSQADGSRVRISQVADEEIVSWRPSLAPTVMLMLVVTGQSLLKTFYTPLRGTPN